MNFVEFIPLTAAGTNLFLALFVYRQNPRAKLSRIYLLWGGSIVLWNLGTFAMFRVSAGAEAEVWAKVIQFAVIFLPISLFHLCSIIAHVAMPKTLRFLYLLAFFFALSNCTSFFVSGVRYVNELGAYYTVGGTGFSIFSVVYLLLTFATIRMLHREQRKLPPLHRKRLRSLLLATVILFVFGTNDIMPILGWYHYPFTQVRVIPVGSMAAIFYGVIVGYSVLQHQLLDIHVTLGKIAANLVRILFLSLTSTLLLFVAALFVPRDQFPPYAFFSSLAAFLVSAIVASLLFPRLFGKGDDILERRILGDRFEYQDQVNSFIQSLPAYTHVGLLLDDLHDLLVNIVKVESYQIILLDETTRQFSLFRAYPSKPAADVAELDVSAPLLRYFDRTSAEYLPFKLVYTVPGETELERAARQQLNQFRPEFCFPLLFNKELFGLMLVGEKSSGELYTPHDVRLLIELVKSLSLILNQIRLKKQVLLAEELELLGRMSRGMAHDLNNLLTPVSTLLQLLKDGFVGADKTDELLPVALRNIGTMQSYIREALFFSQNHTLRLEPARLDLAIRKAIDTTEPKLKRKQVSVVFDPPFELVAEIDSVLIQRLVANLLSNAVDASPPGSRITIQVQRLAKTEASRDWVRIKVIDEGEGISPGHLKRIFTPYYTTKDRGDETRGFGLGLSICRQIVHLHGGNLNIASQEKKGTSVLVDLPSHQVNRPTRALAAYA